jgi:hypothetical protein
MINFKPPQGETLSDVVMRYRGFNDAIRGEARPLKAAAAYLEGFSAGTEARNRTSAPGVR